MSWKNNSEEIDPRGPQYPEDLFHPSYSRLGSSTRFITVNSDSPARNSTSENFWGTFSLVDEGERFANGLMMECFGVAIIILIGCGAATMTTSDSEYVTLNVAFAFGASMAAIMHIAGPISGGLLNPAVTLGFLVAGKIRVVKAIILSLYQFVGAVIGAVFLSLVIPNTGNKQNCATAPRKDTTVMMALVIEIILTFTLTILMISVSTHIKAKKGYPAIIIGLYVTAAHIFAFERTGCGMNPARSVGAAVFVLNWTNIWIYVAGPYFGAFVSGIASQLILSKVRNASEATSAEVSNLGEEILFREFNISEKLGALDRSILEQKPSELANKAGLEGTQLSSALNDVSSQKTDAIAKPGYNLSEFKHERHQMAHGNAKKIGNTILNHYQVLPDIT